MASSVLSGVGCPNCARYGFKSDEEAAIYAFDIRTPSGRFIGFGISNTPSIRFKQHARSFERFQADGDLLFSYTTSGALAHEYELWLKKTLPCVSTGIPGFHTEAIVYDEQLLAVIHAKADIASKLYEHAKATR